MGFVLISCQLTVLKMKCWTQLVILKHYNSTKYVLHKKSDWKLTWKLILVSSGVIFLFIFITLSFWSYSERSIWSQMIRMRWWSGNRGKNGLMGSWSVEAGRSLSCRSGTPLYWIPSAGRWHFSLLSSGRRRNLSGSPELSCKILNESTSVN